MHKILIISALLMFVSGDVSAQPHRGKQKPTAVIVVKVVEKLFTDEVEALGTLRANESVELTASVTELVTKVNFKDGQRVKKGDILLEMEVAEEMAQLSEEQSNLNEAKGQLERIEALSQKGVSSQSTLDEQKRVYNSSKARLEAIESRINQRRIQAPFDGIVGLRNISVGALVQPGTRITTIDDDSVMKLDFSVPAVFLKMLKIGVKIHAKARAFEGEIFNGEVTSVDSRVDPITRSIIVRAIIENKDLKLKPGLLMSVVLHKNPRQTLVIPEESIVPSGKEHMVFVIVDEGEKIHVEKRKIIIGARRVGEVEVLQGLADGERIVTHGTLKMKNNKAVSIITEQHGDVDIRKILNSKQPNSMK